MPPTEGGLVLIGGGEFGGRFAVSRLNMVGLEDIKLVCNGENGRRTETHFTIWFYEIVWQLLVWWSDTCHGNPAAYLRARGLCADVLKYEEILKVN